MSAFADTVLYERKPLITKLGASMKTIPVDCAVLTTLVGGEIQPATTPDGSQRRNAAGQPLFSVPVVAVVQGGEPSTFVARVPGPVPQIPALTPIRLIGLVARPWSMDGRSGVSFSAESVQPASASARS